MNLYNLSDKIVFKILQSIDSGYLEITNYHGDLIKFGNPEDTLRANIRIKKSNFTYNLISILYEVKNTFGEQHTYIFEVKNNNILQHSCSKKFHVSPFIEMNCNYFFKILKPGEKISVIIDQYQSNEKLLYASQDGKRVDFTSTELIKSYLKHPLMTFKIISAIHFEAFKLWAKGIRFVKKKLKIKNNITFEN